MKGTFVFKSRSYQVNMVKTCFEKTIPLSSYGILIHLFSLNITVGIQKLDITELRFACGPTEVRIGLLSGICLFL